MNFWVLRKTPGFLWISRKNWRRWRPKFTVRVSTSWLTLTCPTWTRIATSKSIWFQKHNRVSRYLSGFFNRQVRRCFQRTKLLCSCARYSMHSRLPRPKGWVTEILLRTTFLLKLSLLARTFTVMMILSVPILFRLLTLDSTQTCSRKTYSRSLAFLSCTVLLRNKS